MIKHKTILNDTISLGFKVAFSIAEVSTLTSVGRTNLFAEIKAGRLVARKQGRRTIVISEDLAAWLSALPRNVTLDGGAK